MSGTTRSILPLLLTAICSAAALAARPAEAQFTRAIKERVAQKAAERKERTKETLIERATEPADSALERVMSPVDSVAGEIGGAAAAAVSRAGRGPDPVAAEEARLRRELEAGAADLPKVGFEPGTDGLTEPSLVPLTALARVLAGERTVFLVKARADAEADQGWAAELAELRALAVKNWLVENEVAAARIFAVGEGTAAPGSAVVSVVRVK